MKSTPTSPMFISLTKIEEANLSGGQSIIGIGADGVGVGVDGADGVGVGVDGVPGVSATNAASLQIGASDRSERAESRRARLENRLRRAEERLERLRSRLSNL